MSIADRSRYAAAGFVVLLLAAVLWPSPVVSANRLWFHDPLAIDELSFLGREAPSWDVAFWCIAGLFAIALVHSGDASIDEARHVAADLRRMRFVMPRYFAIGFIAAVVLIAVTWTIADMPVVAFAERIQSDTVEDTIRVVNRLGGGMNPPMIVLFFVVAGLAYRRERWVGYGVAMAIAAISAGILAQILKFVIGRTRPELWLGPFHYVRTTANSFPSGHTVAAFALAGVILFASRSIGFRVIALTLAIGVAAARVLAFRHWPSDVVASALISLLAASVATAAVSRVTSDSPGAV